MKNPKHKEKALAAKNRKYVTIVLHTDMKNLKDGMKTDNRNHAERQYLLPSSAS